jgi:hypothetical protein
MEKIFALIAISTVLITGTLFTASIMNQTVLGAQDCDLTPTGCHGGFGYKSGGTGGRFQIDDSTYTQSIGGGSKSDPGGGGGHFVLNLATGESTQSGGNSITGGGRTTCDASYNCETTGR